MTVASPLLEFALQVAGVAFTAAVLSFYIYDTRYKKGTIRCIKKDIEKLGNYQRVHSYVLRALARAQADEDKEIDEDAVAEHLPIEDLSPEDFLENDIFGEDFQEARDEAR